MRRKKRQPIFVRNCDYCGTQLQTNEPNSDSYVITAEHKIFCKIHYVGEPPIKDCLEDYIRSKNVRNEKKKIDEKYDEEKKEISKKEKEKVLKKFEDYLFELKQKQRRQRAAKFQTKTYSESKSTI